MRSAAATSLCRSIAAAAAVRPSAAPNAAATADIATSARRRLSSRGVAKAIRRHAATDIAGERLSQRRCRAVDAAALGAADGRTAAAAAIERHNDVAAALRIIRDNIRRPSEHFAAQCRALVSRGLSVVFRRTSY